MLAYNFLYWGTFIFAIANGTLEAVANPLVATLFPSNRTHYLNILHASWPAGLVLGGAIGWVLGEQFGWHWKWQLGLFLLPTLGYGLMFFGQRMPQSEAAKKGLSLGRDVQGRRPARRARRLLPARAVLQRRARPADDVGVRRGGRAAHWCRACSRSSRSGSFLLFVLFVAHLLIGAVELGTDGWIQNITGNILDPGRRQAPVRHHLARHVRAALHRRLHREAHRPFAGRHPADLFALRHRRPAS